MRVNVKVELGSTLFKYARSFIHCRYIIYPHKNYATVEIHTKERGHRGHHDNYIQSRTKVVGKVVQLNSSSVFSVTKYPPSRYSIESLRFEDDI